MTVPMCAWMGIVLGELTSREVLASCMTTRNVPNTSDYGAYFPM